MSINAESFRELLSVGGWAGDHSVLMERRYTYLPRAWRNCVLADSTSPGDW
jgi:hypothetical protein